MKRFFTVATAVAVMLISGTSTQAQMAGLQSFDTVAGKSDLVQKTGKRSHRNGAVAAGIALGVLGAAAAAHAHRDNHYRDRRWSRHKRNCRRWRRWCHHGDDRACWRYDNRC